MRRTFLKSLRRIDEGVQLIPQDRIQQRNVEQRVVVLILQVVTEMVKADEIIPGAYGVHVSVATQRQVPTTRTVQKTVEILLQLQSLTEW